MDIKVLSRRKIQSERANKILCEFIVNRKQQEENRIFLTGNATPTEDFFQIVSQNLLHFQNHLNETLYGPSTKSKIITDEDDSELLSQTPIPVDDPNYITPLKDSSNQIQIYTDTNNEDGDVSEKYSDISSSGGGGGSTNKKGKHVNNSKSSDTEMKSSSDSTVDSDNEESDQDLQKKLNSPKSKSIPPPSTSITNNKKKLNNKDSDDDSDTKSESSDESD
eukprot:gene1365-1723_t